MSIESRVCHCGATASLLQDATANCRCHDVGEWIRCDYCGKEIVETKAEPVSPYFDQDWHRACWRDALVRQGWVGEPTTSCDTCDMPVPLSEIHTVWAYGLEKTNVCHDCTGVEWEQLGKPLPAIDLRRISL